LDTVVLLLVDVTGSIVISHSRCCLPNDEGPAPPPEIFFLESPLLFGLTSCYNNRCIQLCIYVEMTSSIV